MIRAFPADIAFALSFLLATTAAHAQAPTRLMPPAEPAALQQAAPEASSGEMLRQIPRRVEPRVQPSSASSTITAKKENFTVDTSSRRSIQVEGLAEIDPNSVGVLSIENGGLGEDMW
ncbi:MAG: hypothetical protein ACJ0UT_11330, partial [Candidatus Latescibacterota bacterium]